MTMIAAFLLAVGFSSVTTVDEIFTRCRMQNPRWYTCSQDADCVVIPNPCGYPLEADGGKTEASCINKQCVAKRMTKK